MLRKVWAIFISMLLLCTAPSYPALFSVKAEENGLRSSSIAFSATSSQGMKPVFQTGTITRSSDSASPANVVIEYLNKHKEEYQLKGGASFQTIEQLKDPVKKGYVVRLQQTYRGIPIFGATQAAHVGEDGSLRTLSGSVAAFSQTINIEPKITGKQAIDIAKKDLGEQVHDFVKTPAAKLNIYMKDNHPYLVYVVELNYLGGKPGRWLYFVDAKNGNIVHKFNSLQFGYVQGTGKGVLGKTRTLQMEKDSGGYSLVDKTRGSGIVTHDAANSLNLPGKVWRSKDNKLDSRYEASAVDAHYFAGIVYDYYKKVHRRNGLDGQGGEIHSTVHYAKEYNNAFWNGYQIVFGDGDGETFLPLSGALDVVAHELTHAVTENTANLIYEGESGAINEAVSDIFGELIEFYAEKRIDWTIGEDVYTPGISNDALRSLKDPAAYGYPDHYLNRYTGIEDNGGVHINSSIINKAAYLISEGGAHYGVQVKGIGKEKLGKILYRTLTCYLTSSSNFHQLRLAMIQAAKDLYKDGQEVETVNQAFHAVGIDGPGHIHTLAVGGTAKATLQNEGDSVWFKVTPSSSMIANKSHLHFEVSGVEATISVYPSWKDAEGQSTYPPYKEQLGEVDFPLSWKGPYYVKVTVNEPGTMTIINRLVYKAPAEQDPTSCLAEMAAKEQPSLKDELSVLRHIREQLLRPSTEGKQIISLYYQISRETIGDFIVDKAFRDDLIRYLRQLAPIIAELEKAANGQPSSYRLSEQDYQTLVELKNRLESKVSSDTKETIRTYWKELDIDHHPNITVTELLERIGLPNTVGNSGPLIVKMKKTKSEQQAKQNLEKALGMQQQYVLVKPLANRVAKIPYTYMVLVNDPNKIYKVMQQLASAKTVEFVEKSTMGMVATSDVYYPQQWSLKNKKKTNADIHYEEMVKRLKGKKLPKTIVAVIDTGVNNKLADLDGVVDSKHGFDFVNNNSEAMDDLSHGTSVASIIAAKKDNHYSIAGINPYVTILSLKACGADGMCSSEDVALAIKYAVAKGAKVINLSFGFSKPSRIIEEQLKYAYGHGVTIVAAAGNGGEKGLDYPANSSYAISVGATNENDEVAWFSNIDSKLDLVAPGDFVPAITAYGEVALLSGTSLAAAHVSAAAALIYSWKKNDVSPGEVQQILTKTSQDFGKKGQDDYYGYGRIDAGKIAYALGKQAAAPKVNTIDDNDKTIQGTAQPGVTIVALNGSRLLGKTKADRKGKFVIKIAPQKAKMIVSVYAETAYGVRSSVVKKVVLDKTPPKAPKVNSVTSRSKQVTGKTEVYATVTVKAGGKTLGKATASKTGTFRIQIKAQKAGTLLKVYATDRAGNTSKATVVRVKR
ncbi:Bacillolysin (neutral protease) [Parageobacillus genomosp. 1]|uniref:Bacillolysin (Neutral protease) n=1 Tax=Parageobacillus genomosp. 1 TaxID=1295642 RepID=A0ABC9VAN8_9BACL|nr:M4 family metallopeptidase [Parageobacillus genomosp. 1]EZP75153.1 Bacillolysin (neutral protease) [Parageobacillus genomosp. 1]